MLRKILLRQWSVDRALRDRLWQQPPEPTLTAVSIDDTVMADGGNYEYGRVYLVESGGDLYMVHLLFRLTYEGGDEIDRCCIHRMDFSTLRWCNVRDLGGRAFLLSRFYFGASWALFVWVGLAYKT